MVRVDLEGLFKKLRGKYLAYKLDDKIIVDFMNEKDKLATLHITKDKKVEICIGKELMPIILQPAEARKMLKSMIEVIDSIEEFSRYK